MKTRTLIHSLAASAFLLVGSSAHALIIPIGVGNAALAGYPTPFGQANVVRNSNTTATVTFTAFANVGGTTTYAFGGQDAVALNINAASFTVSAGTATSYGGGTPVPQFTDGSGNVSTFGSFNLTRQNFDGVTYSMSSVTFGITAVGTNWAADADVLVANASGNSVAAHIFAFANGNNSTALVTGFATGGSTPTNTPPVPDSGSTLMLLGAGVGVLALLRRKLA